MSFSTLLRFSVVMLAFMVLGAGSSVANGLRWVEETFEDFSDGRLDAAGQNIYVSWDGKIRTIHRFDLNQDGFIDLLFNSTHDTRAIVSATQATVAADRSVTVSPLAVQGSLEVAFDDFNKDGYLDAVFCPNDQGIQHPRRFLTILWGGSDGWPAHRSNGLLPVHGAKAVAICDLNADGASDIATLNSTAWIPGQPEGQIVRVYWGGERGFLLAKYCDIGVEGALDISAGDFDGDGNVDLAVLKSNHSTQVFWASTDRQSEGESGSTRIVLPSKDESCLTGADYNSDGRIDLVVGTNDDAIHLIPSLPGREWGDSIKISAGSASHIAVGNLDADDHPDLVLTRMEITRAAGGERGGIKKQADANVRVLWGGAEGFEPSRKTDLDLPQASSTAIGDVDGDGKTDLAIAVYQGEKTFDAKSAILFGDGTRDIGKVVQGVPTSGAVHVLITPAEQQSPQRIVFCNSQGGTLHERVPLDLYWGGPEGFSVNHRLRIPFVSGYEASAADLNLDGFVDVVAMCSGHSGAGAEDLSELGANILWGGPDHFDSLGRNKVLREHNLYSSNVADLNKDGYLDLVLGAFAPPSEGEPELLVIYYGGEDGFNVSRRVALPSEGRSSICTIADFDRDDWLDIAVTSYHKDLVRIFRGSPDGFDVNRQDILMIPSPIAMDTADFNSDGYLDLVVGSYTDRVAGHQDTGNLIFWGGEDGFEEWNAQWLPGYTPLGLTVADFDGDGCLDLFSPSYHGDITRESLPSYLYWGSVNGFDTQRRTVLFGDSNAEGLAADFDRDGKIDLAVVCHTRDGNHATMSKIFYNDGNRFDNPRVVRLPTAGAHWMWTEDMGHIYNRGWKQTYQSSPFQWDQKATKGTLSYGAIEAEGSNLSFSVRSATDPAELAVQPWRAVESGRFSVNPEDRCLQYLTTFQSDNGDRFAVLDNVRVELQP